MKKEEPLAPQEVATKRFEIICQLQDPALSEDRSLYCGKKQELAVCYGVSYRTISRWAEAYKAEGFSGLVPKSRAPHTPPSKLPENFEAVVDEAITLRRECPTRSVRTLIRILELEGKIPEGSVRRSTLQRHLQKRGFGMKQVNLYRKESPAARRFQKTHRCDLYQGDIKYGPYLPIGPHGRMVQTYLAAWIDDATRYVVGAGFYANQKTDIIEDTLRQALMAFGQPQAIYVDNGKQYRSDWLRKACAKLGIQLLHAKAYHPEGKGKIERFNRSIDAFLAECALEKPKTLGDLNASFRAWLDGTYHKDPHAGLSGMSPETAWRMDTRLVFFPDQDALREAFLHTETRSVDKTGCISFNGTQYEVGRKLIGRKVEVLYDPTWQEEVEIRHPDFPHFRAKKLTIGENCKQEKELSENFKVETDHSRLLDGLKKTEVEQAKAGHGHATDFSGLAKEVLAHV